MKNNPLFKKEESAGLRCRLETCLTGVFAEKKINNYLVADCCEPDFQFLPVNTDQATAVTQIKLAYAIWAGMHTTDRLAVLTQFQYLYATLPTVVANRQTLTFCMVFIHEFAGILAGATQWPD